MNSFSHDLLRQPKKRSGFGHCDELNLLVAIVGILALLAIPNFKKARAKAHLKSCRATCIQLEKAAGVFLQKKAQLPVRITDVHPYFPETLLPQCPSMGTYSWLIPHSHIGSSTLFAVCSVHSSLYL